MGLLHPKLWVKCFMWVSDMYFLLSRTWRCLTSVKLKCVCANRKLNRALDMTKSEDVTETVWEWVYRVSEKYRLVSSPMIHWICQRDSWMLGITVVKHLTDVRFEVFTAVTMKNAVFWGYEYPGHTSEETRYFSATEPSRLILWKIWGFHGGDYVECRPLGYDPVWLL
jgi:hypothetical protein